MFFYPPHTHAALPKCLQKRDVRCGYFHHQRDPIEREGYPLIGGQLSVDCINKLILAFPKCLYKIVDETNKDDLDYEYPVMKKLMLTMTKCVDAKLCRNSVIHRNRFMTFRLGRMIALCLTFNSVNNVPRMPISRFTNKKKCTWNGRYFSGCHQALFYHLMVPIFARNLKAIYDVWKKEGITMEEDIFNCPLHTAWNAVGEYKHTLKNGIYDDWFKLMKEGEVKDEKGEKCDGIFIVEFFFMYPFIMGNIAEHKVKKMPMDIYDKFWCDRGLFKQLAVEIGIKGW